MGDYFWPVPQTKKNLVTKYNIQETTLDIIVYLII